MKVKVKAPAKINLSLDVLGKRPDGYHEIATVMQAVSLYDFVTIETSDSGRVEIVCDYPSVPCDESNIVYKACVEFFKYIGEDMPSLKITIDKLIPTGAGLAGGSADGAAVIVGLNKMFTAHLKEDELCEIGTKVGADVPFCIVGGTQLAKGTGTDMEKLTMMPRCKLVICKPEFSVSTAEAYSRVDSANLSHPQYTLEMVRAIYARDIYMTTATLFNDFEIALDLDEIKSIKGAMLKCKALGTSMSGSGSAVFGVFNSDRKAEKCLKYLKETYNKVFICEPIKLGCTVID